MKFDVVWILAAAVLALSMEARGAGTADMTPRTNRPRQAVVDIRPAEISPDRFPLSTRMDRVAQQAAQEGDFPDLCAMNAIVAPPSGQTPRLRQLSQDPDALTHDQVAVPLPPGVVSGGILLAALGLLGMRKRILRFIH